MSDAKEPHTTALAGSHILIADLAEASDLVTFLTARGAEVTVSPLLGDQRRIDERGVLVATRALLDDAPSVLLVDEASSFTTWWDVVYAHDLHAEVRKAVDRGFVVARGSRAREAVQDAGLTIAWDATDTPVEDLVTEVVRRHDGPIRIIPPGVEDDGVARAFASAGVAVHSIIPLVWGPPADLPRVLSAISDVTSGEFDAVVFTSAVATRRWLDTVTTLQVTDVLRARVEYGDLVFVALGQSAAEPVRALGMDPIVAAEPRTGALVRALVESVGHNVHGIATEVGVLRLRARGATLNGAVLPVSPSGLALLRALAREPGALVQRKTLLTLLPGRSANEHALDVAVGRLRAVIGSRAVETVPKKGYRLRLAD